jgi:hypothetical protein
MSVRPSFSRLNSRTDGLILKESAMKLMPQETISINTCPPTQVASSTWVEARFLYPCVLSFLVAILEPQWVTVTQPDTSLLFNLP